MSEYELRSKISSLERECSQLESDNSEMRSEIRVVCNSIASAAATIRNCGNNAVNNLVDSENDINTTIGAMDEILARKRKIEYLYQGFKNIESANKKIRELNNRKYYDFATYRTVRKIVRAYIDNITLDMVNSELIYQSVEREHLQSPDFWLSCCMLAIMHWKEDNKDAADRAIKMALELNERNAVLFFMSFNLLLGRKEVALAWFECYLKIPKTGDDADFILLLLHATNFRDDTKDKFAQRIKSYIISEFEKSKGMNDLDDVANKIKNHLVQYNSSETVVFDALRNYVNDYSTMSLAMSLAKDNNAILKVIEEYNVSSRGRGYIFVEKFIYDLLEIPDEKEKALTDEIMYNEMIIKHSGDIAAADKEYKGKQKHAASSLNLLEECVNWLFGPTNAQLSEVAKGNMFMLCRENVKAAAEIYFSDYRKLNKTTHPVTIKDYSTKMNFKNQSEEVAKATDFYLKKKESLLATVRNGAIVTMSVFASLFAVGAIVALAMGESFKILAILAGVLGISFGIGAVAKHFGNKKRRNQIESNAQAASAEITAIIQKLFDEFKIYQETFKEYDRVSEEVIFAIERK